MASEYERQRLANIERNAAKLAELELAGHELLPANIAAAKAQRPKPTARRPKARGGGGLPPRRSRRAQQQPAAVYSADHAEDDRAVAAVQPASGGALLDPLTRFSSCQVFCRSPLFLSRMTVSEMARPSGARRSKVATGSQTGGGAANGSAWWPVWRWAPCSALETSSGQAGAKSHCQTAIWCTPPPPELGRTPLKEVGSAN